jgi:hypothetical protein
MLHLPVTLCAGGETFILQPHVLGGFFESFDSSRGLELPDLATIVPQHFSSLTVFDPRAPHGVRTVLGTRDARRGRLVLHGAFLLAFTW